MSESQGKGELRNSGVRSGRVHGDHLAQCAHFTDEGPGTEKRSKLNQVTKLDSRSGAGGGT